MFNHFLIVNLEVSITSYNLRLQSSIDAYSPQIVLSDTNNRMALQAALTSMLQQDSTTMGSVVDIDSAATSRSLSNSNNLIFDLTVTGNKSCSAVTCLHQFQSRVINSLCNSNKTTSFIRYQQSNSSQTYWLKYRLPNTTSSSKYPRTISTLINPFILDASYTSVDSKAIASELSTLIAFDQSQNGPTTEVVITTTEAVTTTSEAITTTSENATTTTEGATTTTEGATTTTTVD